WTDVIQGGVLMVGFTVLVWLLFDQFGSLADATRALPAAKKDPPNAVAALEWTSWILIVGLGGALYPQAIQRIYAARNARALRRSLMVMAFLPLTTTLVAVVFGVMAAANRPEIEQGDAVLTVVCSEIQDASIFGRWLVVVLFAGILAAVMSTADSALLSISSMFTKDIYVRHISPQASQKQLTTIGKFTSWTVIAAMTVAACLLYDVQLVTVLRIKFELLVQLAPAFLIGVNWRGLRTGPVLWGMVAGVTIAVGLTISSDVLRLVGIDSPRLSQVYGVHAGIYGVIVNTTIAVVGSLLTGRPSRDPSRAT
ncbi:MAG: hypothetical protein QF805_23355, partial [Pirellulaceae bacterium]|nr:hypothetical protein [Pirellulaceae bacterium]